MTLLLLYGLPAWATVSSRKIERACYRGTWLSGADGQISSPNHSCI